jgi:adenylate kinase
MPSVQRIPRIRANVRWNRELEIFEMYCPDCVVATNAGANFWPLSEEFWIYASLQRCRACNLKKDADRIAKRRREDPEFRARQVEQSRAIRGYPKERMRTS